MNSPILVWMLYLNREVTTEVSIFLFPHRHIFFPFPSLFPFPGLNCPLKEYEKCYELIHNTVPHAKNIPSNPTSGESLRSFAPFPISRQLHPKILTFSIWQAKSSPK
jgi:4'-phosphopantetheinyl transferase